MVELNPEVTSVWPRSPLNPLANLAPFCETIREMRITGHYMMPSLSGCPVYPAVQKVVWLDMLAENCRALVHILCFPNLRELDLGLDQYETFYDDEQGCRAMNLQHQAQGHKFPALEMLTGGVVKLYALALQGPVKHLNINHVDRWNLEKVPNIIAASPSELLTVEVMAVAPARDNGQRTLLEHLARKVTTLTINILMQTTKDATPIESRNDLASFDSACEQFPGLADDLLKL